MAKLTTEQTMLRAKSHEKKGEFDQARLLYKMVIDAFPNNKRAQQALAALDKPKTVVSNKDANPPQDQLGVLVALYNKGKLSSAVEKAQLLVLDFPSSFVLWNILGAANNGLGRLEEAEASFRKAVEANPNYADAFNNLGVTLKEQGKLEDAIDVYRRALKIKPDYAEAYNNMGDALKEQGKLGAAIEACQLALKNKPDYAEAYNNMANALKQQGKLDPAIEAYQCALKINPDYEVAYDNMGKTLQDQGKLDQAIDAYQRALKLNPDRAETYFNIGCALNEQGNVDAAIEAYQGAVKIIPDYAEAHNNIGYTLKEQGKLDEAIEAYRRALKVKPNFAEAHNNLGAALQDQGTLDAAIEAYRHALQIKPDYAEAEAQMLHLQSHLCDWNLSNKLNDICARLGLTTTPIPVFTMLSLEDNAERQLVRSRIWASETYKQKSLVFTRKPKARPKRLKVGYFGADFHDHATLYLMAGLLRDYDSAQFEVFAYSYGRSTSGGWRQKAEQDVDYFFDVTDKSDHAILNLVGSHGLDIAIDLKGYTGQTRLALFQYRLAPIQISYLGYPGSLGADFIDYIIADPIVIPSSQRKHYSEKIIYLPHSYQPNDDQRHIAQTNTTRADFGLPDDAFVFCCFNNSYKISPREFDIWMRILTKVEGSVLWLLKSNKWAEGNLRREAQARGIDPSRVVFAEMLPHAEHLARHKHADLFIDTFNCNAHTTASDALWAGLPVVTKQGNQFAARVAASLLNAVGLPELVTTTEVDYEALIIELATNSNKLKAIKDRLAVNRLTQPLFDTKRYTRNFERGLQKVYDIYFAGEAPQDAWVESE